MSKWFDLAGICSDDECDNEGTEWCAECGRPICWIHTVHHYCLYCMSCRARARILGTSGYIHRKNRIHTSRVIRKRVRIITKSWAIWTAGVGWESGWFHSLAMCPGVLDKFNLTYEKDLPKFTSRDRARAKQEFIHEMKMENGEYEKSIRRAMRQLGVRQMVGMDAVVKAFQEGRSEGIRGANKFVTDGRYLYRASSGLDGKKKYVVVARRVKSVLFGFLLGGDFRERNSLPPVKIYVDGSLDNDSIIEYLRGRIAIILSPQSFIRSTDHNLRELRKYDEVLITMKDSGEFDDDEIDALRNAISQGVELYGMQYRFLLGE